MRRSLLLLAACSMSALAADEWIEVGADTEAKYYVNKSTVEFDGDTVRFQKRAIYTKPLADNFTGVQVMFKESVGVVELDCKRHVNRVVAIDMIGVDGKIVWSSGKMPQRTWEDVRDDTHGGSTYQYVCTTLAREGNR